MGRGGNEFYLPRLHTLLSYTYLLPYPYPTGMRNRISSPSPTDLGIPDPSISSSPPWIFFNKNKSIFQFWAQCCNALSNKEMLTIDDYGDLEETGRECEILKDKRENYDKWVSFERLRLWLCEWNDLRFRFLFI
jgi:hypothetical protein